MKKLLLLLFSILVSFNSYGLFEKTVCVDTDAQIRNGIIYLPNKTKPFTGKNICEYENGQYKSEGKVKDGKLDGKWTRWYENGQKKSEGSFTDDGSSISKTKQISYSQFLQNVKQGNVSSVTIAGSNISGLTSLGEKFKTHSPGDLGLMGDLLYYGVSVQATPPGGEDEETPIYGKKIGKWTEWYVNGQIQYEGYFKDGNYQGAQTYWYENGQLMSEKNYKDGKIDGKFTEWDKYGQIRSEGTYKHGELNINVELNIISTELSEYELFAKGEAIYNANCSACHQKDGSGLQGVFPAMSDSSIANGPAADHLNIVFNGKGGMPAFKMLGDLDLASVITYERRAFGNNGSVVQPSDVWLVRKRVEAETN